MDAVIVVAPSTFESELRRRLERAGLEPRSAGDDALLVEDDDSRVYVGRDDAVRHDFEAETLAIIAASGASPEFYYVEFSDIELCRRVIVAIADDPDLFVDNDHGVFAVGSEFVRMLLARPGWDWRIPAANRHRLALHLPERVLRESTEITADYVDDLGRTYDRMGNLEIVPHWSTQRDDFLRQIDRHLGRADFTIIDLVDFPSYIRDEVRAYVLRLSEGDFDKIVPMGF